MVIEGLRHRRSDVLDDLLATYGHEIQAVAYLILRDREDAEDVVIETLVTALDHGPQLRDASALRAWLLRIAANQALGMRRKQGRVVRLGGLPEIAERGHEASSVSRVDIADALDALPPQMRAAVVLHYYADLSVAEVAASLGKSPNTIKAQLRTALEQLRTQFIDPPRSRSSSMEASNV